VNVSRFNGRIIGPGGFPNISQNAKKVIFSGTLTAGGLDIVWQDGSTIIRQEGRYPKFINQLEQITYNGDFGWHRGQEILFITERAVFRRQADGLAIIEYAPGVDLETHIMDQMEFRPLVSSELREMEQSLFLPERMNLYEKHVKNTNLNLSPRLIELFEQLKDDFNESESI
jgi:propionate CoA-transferase